ncbi:hypothetical protein SFR_1904 [Streptomyces sp. FR-008]|nr:hypothetical protein SFR_1904 [Streptomyces sp. FR-008]
MFDDGPVSPTRRHPRSPVIPDAAVRAAEAGVRVTGHPGAGGGAEEGVGRGGCRWGW